MKKIFAIILTILLITTGCGDKTKNEEQKNDNSNEVVKEEENVSIAGKKFEYSVVFELDGNFEELYFYEDGTFKHVGLATNEYGKYSVKGKEVKLEYLFNYDKDSLIDYDFYDDYTEIATVENDKLVIKRKMGDSSIYEVEFKKTEDIKGENLSFIDETIKNRSKIEKDIKNKLEETDKKEEVLPATKIKTDNSTGKYILYGYDKNNKQVWKIETGIKFIPNSDAGLITYSDDDNIYYVNDKGLVAVKKSNGKVLWTKTDRENYEFGTSVKANNNLYILTGYVSGQRLFVFDTTNGKTILDVDLNDYFETEDSVVCAEKIKLDKDNVIIENFVSNDDGNGETKTSEFIINTKTNKIEYKKVKNS